MHTGVNSEDNYFKKNLCTENSFVIGDRFVLYQIVLNFDETLGSEMESISGYIVILNRLSRVYICVRKKLASGFDDCRSVRAHQLPNTFMIPTGVLCARQQRMTNHPKV